MKPHIRSKGPVFSSRLRGPHAAGRVLESIKNITSELENLQAEIYSRMGGPAVVLEGFSSRERGAAERALSDFKLALDQLRYVLWLSLEPQAREAGETRAEGMPVPADDRSHPQAAGDMRLLPPRVKPSEQATTSASFFDRLDVVIDAYMGKNTPPYSAPRKRVKP
jgi:hypothetical protein